MNKNSIGIIGMGWVGASVAISLLHEGIAEELLLNDIQSEIAEGEAMDLIHGSTYYPSAAIRACSIEEMAHCRAIVITAGRGGKPGESRLDLLNENAKIVTQIAARLKGFAGFLVIVANPVDVLTQLYQQATGLDTRKVIGTGTLLDTARLRQMVGAHLNIDARSIHANVIGEHGDSEVVLWSSAHIASVLLRDWSTWRTEFEVDLAHRVKTAAQEIIKRKGATNHAIGLVTASLLKWILRGERRIVNVSSIIKGPYGINNVALSLPSLLSKEGIEKILTIKINEIEMEQLQNSADVIKKALNSISK
ncbi:MAG: L-lactate dehydrogenase [Cyclobacteriaceae bacterium]|nr:L-lactate dehydrogenase [Cyclobacteriaceae bacterium]